MEIYYYILYVLAFLALINDFIYKIKFIKYTIIFILAIFLSVREGVGNDYEEYYAIFESIKSSGYTYTYVEPFYYILNFALEDFRYVIIFTSCLAMFLLNININYFGKRYYYISLLVFYGVFFILYDIHLIRQGIAIMLILFSYRYLIEDKRKKFILISIFAVGFHLSSLFVILFLLFLYPRINLDTRKRNFILLVAVLVYVSMLFLKDILFSLLASLSITSRYAEVYNNENYSYTYGLSLGALFDIVLLLFINNRKIIYDKKELLVLNLFTYSVFVSIAFNDFAIFLRLGYYLRVLLIFMFIYFYKLIPKKVFAYIFIVIYSYFYLNTSLTKGNGVETLNYRTVYKNNF